MAASGSQPSSSCARWSAGSSAALRRSAGYLATALAKPSSKRFCCSGEKGDGACAALVPREIIAARTNMALGAECQGTVRLQAHRGAAEDAEVFLVVWLPWRRSAQARNQRKKKTPRPPRLRGALEEA